MIKRTQQKKSWGKLFFVGIFFLFVCFNLSNSNNTDIKKKKREREDTNHQNQE